MDFFIPSTKKTEQIFFVFVTSEYISLFPLDFSFDDFELF